MNLLDLIEPVAVGLGVAALVFALSHLLRKLGVSVPRWLLPASVGAAMIGYAIWADYAWYNRVQAALPADSQVVSYRSETRWWAPWTLLAPVPLSLAVINPSEIVQKENGILETYIYLYDRRTAGLGVPQEFDCATGRYRAARQIWIDAGPNDRAFRIVCPDGGA